VLLHDRHLGQRLTLTFRLSSRYHSMQLTIRLQISRTQMTSFRSAGCRRQRKNLREIIRIHCSPFRSALGIVWGRSKCFHRAFIVIKPRLESSLRLSLRSVAPLLTLASLAYHEMRLMLATVLWNFDLTFCEESDNWPDQQCYSLWEKHPLLVKLTPIRRT